MNTAHLDTIREQQREWGRHLLNEARNASALFIFGTTKYAERILHYMVGRGQANITFIDDHRAGDRFAGSPVIALHEVPANACVISGVVEGRPKTVHHLLTSAGHAQVGNYYHLNLCEPVHFPVPFWQHNVADIQENAAKYALLHNFLADDLSRNTLQDLLHFRYTNDYLSGALTYRLHEQYWEPFIQMDRISSFVDGGSFDGRTALQFIERQPAYSQVHVFEPFPQSLANARHTLQGKVNVHFHPYALLDTRKTLRFTSDAGSANGLDPNGDIRVQTCSLDEALGDTPIGMIKLDIEGAEPEALIGARHLVERHRPILAVCVYHHQSHFWRIPEQILGWRPDYRVFLRHYTEGVYESVMYFI
jgi:FkbM family methyltransferase